MASAVAAKEMQCEDGADMAVSEGGPSFHTALEVLPFSEVGAVVEVTTSSSSNQYYSARTQWMIENRDKFSSQVEFEIECSKVHHTCVERRKRSAEEGEGSEGEGDEDEDEEEDERELDEEILQANRETISELRLDPEWECRFQEWRDGVYEIGEQIGKGGEATIYAGIDTTTKQGDLARHVVFKVYPKGYLLRELVEQWPKNSADLGVRVVYILHVMLLPNDDGRIAMVMWREWGDLRRLIDMKKVANNNQGPPFDLVETLEVMHSIAYSMEDLHVRDVVHRDLKAANILLLPFEDHQMAWNRSNDVLPFFVEQRVYPLVSDWECALCVLGTGFWRAPEVLLDTRDPIKRQSPTSLFTKASDVYSYGMLCYEIATGFFPFEREGYRGAGTKAEQDRVIGGERPTFPDDVDRRVKDVIVRCWEENANARPTLEKVQEELEHLCQQMYHSKK